MTAADGDNNENGTNLPMSATCEGDQCCGRDHPEEDVSGEVESNEVESNCGGGCCADDDGSDCGSNADHCEDSCCGPRDNDSVQEGPSHTAEQPGTDSILPCIQDFLMVVAHTTPDTCCSAGSPKAKSGHPSCCDPVLGGDEEPPAAGKCIPDGDNGCQRAALFKSTCCGSYANSTPGTFLIEQVVADYSMRICSRNPSGER
jgi:hypothetical protein